MDPLAGGDRGRRGFRGGIGCALAVTGAVHRRPPVPAKTLQLSLHRIHPVDQRRKLATKRLDGGQHRVGTTAGGRAVRGEALAERPGPAMRPTCAGMPTTVMSGGTSRVTTELAPTRARAPTVIARGSVLPNRR